MWRNNFRNIVYIENLTSLKKNTNNLINQQLWFLLLQGVSFYNIHTIYSMLINIFMQSICEDV